MALVSSSGSGAAVQQLAAPCGLCWEVTDVADPNKWNLLVAEKLTHSVVRVSLNGREV